MAKKSWVLIETEEREIKVTKFPEYDVAWKNMLERLLDKDEYFKDEYDECADENGFVETSSEFGINADSAWGNVDSGDTNYDAKIVCVDDLPMTE